MEGISFYMWYNDDIFVLIIYDSTPQDIIIPNRRSYKPLLKAMSSRTCNNEDARTLCGSKLQIPKMNSVELFVEIVTNNYEWEIK